LNEKFAFILGNYALLGVFATSAFGWGRPLAGWIRGSLDRGSLFVLPLQLSAGIGVIMVALFTAGILSQFNAPVVAGLLLIGVALALAPLARQLARDDGRMVLTATSFRQTPESFWWLLAIATIALLPSLLAPLKVPLAWDELMYHLPYARFWAEHGALTVNEWLRYPLSAYNMNLLYGASMLFGSDVFPHLLHALTGALTAVLTFAVARRFFDWRVGLIAVVMVLRATRWGWSNAYVDLALMLFWSCAFAALALRHEHGDPRFSYLAAFFAGIAVGIKYQALFYLPAFVVLALIVEQRSAVIARAVLVFTAIGGYWYLRNALVSGDPLHPIGGPLFGFWLWNVSDLVGQYGDLDRVRSWPKWFFLPALGATLLWRGSTPVQRGLLLSTGTAVALWYLVSGYWRYLVPIYPMLALLSAYVLVELWTRSGAGARLINLLSRLNQRLRRVLLSLVLAVVTVNALDDASRVLGQVLPDQQARGDYLARRFGGYALLRSLGSDPERPLYQLGFEGELYYLGESVRGDWFGPGRYADVLALVDDAAALERHLDRLGANSLLVNLAREPFSRLSWAPNLGDRFELVAHSDQAALYRLQDLRADPNEGARHPPFREITINE
jgi:hypothetical protein